MLFNNNLHRKIKRIPIQHFCNGHFTLTSTKSRLLTEIRKPNQIHETAVKSLTFIEFCYLLIMRIQIKDIFIKITNYLKYLCDI